MSMMELSIFQKRKLKVKNVVWVWFKKGEGIVVQSTLLAVPATTTAPFLNHFV